MTVLLAWAVLFGYSPLSAQNASDGSGQQSESARQVARLQPYSATRTITQVNKLADGATIRDVQIKREARDSAGRTYVATHHDLPNQVDGSGEVYSIEIVDPVAHVRISWNTAVKIAYLVHLQVQPILMPPQHSKEEMAAAHRLQWIPSKQTQEDLGEKTIDGVLVKGRRITDVIPTGNLGNDQPLVNTTEVWNSEKLGLAVLRVEDDPRIGITTDEMSDIVLDDPDPELFRIPEGYTVKESQAMPTVFRDPNFKEPKK